MVRIGEHNEADVRSAVAAPHCVRRFGRIDPLAAFCPGAKVRAAIQRAELKQINSVFSDIKKGAVDRRIVITM